MSLNEGTPTSISPEGSEDLSWIVLWDLVCNIVTRKANGPILVWGREYSSLFFIAAAAEDMSLISGTKFFGCWLLFVLYIWGVSIRRSEDFLSREKSW
jgi:hypothetical protein